MLGARQKIKRVQDAIAEPERMLSICKDMIGDMALWERYSDEIEMNNVSIIEMQDQLRHAGQHAAGFTEQHQFIAFPYQYAFLSNRLTDRQNFYQHSFFFLRLVDRQNYGRS